MATTEEYSIQATGELPLEFEGSLLYEGSTQWVNGKDQNRWNEVRIYKDADETQPYPYLCEIVFQTQWQGEESHTVLYEEENLPGVVERLQSYDPVDFLDGFPTGTHFAEKQRALEERLTRQYEQLITDLMAEMGLRRQRRQKGD